MRDYTIEVEESLSKMYSGMDGLQKRFGIEGLSGFRTEDGNPDFIPAKRIEREIERMNRHAEKFLKDHEEKYEKQKMLMNSTENLPTQKMLPPSGRQPKVMGGLPVRALQPSASSLLNEDIKK